MRVKHLFPTVACICLILCLSPRSGETSEQQSANRWNPDLEYFAVELPKRHINLFFRLSETEFRAQVEALKARCGQMKDYEVVVALMKIVAAVGDSHTMINADQSGIFRKLPVTLCWFSDGLYVVRTIPEFRRLLGRRVTGIEGKTIAQVSERIETVVSRDNPSQLKLRGPNSMIVPEILAALGISAAADSVAITFEGMGAVTIEPVSMHANLNWISCLQDADCPPPLYLQHADSIYWYRHLEEQKTVYVQYRACREKAGRPFAAFAMELFDFIDARDIQRFIFDIRLNGGGNSSIARPVVEGVKQRPGINQSGKLFVIIGRDTYSSAVLNALEFQNETQALFVGEATGGKPNHYGEVKFFLLPRTWIVVTYSTKYFTHSKQDAPSLAPDMETGLTFSEYMSCKDPALEAVLNYR